MSIGLEMIYRFNTDIAYNYLSGGRWLWVTLPFPYALHAVVLMWPLGDLGISRAERGTGCPACIFVMV